MIDIEGTSLGAEDQDRLRHPLVGGVILFSRNFSETAQAQALIAEIRRVRSPPLLVAVDQEGGRVQRFRSGFYPLPPLRWLGHQYDLDAGHGRHLASICGWLMAAELLDVGIDFSFSPVVDLDFGTSEVIGDRAFHRDPEIVATLALAYLQGMRRAGMAGCAKHFPGHGYVVADSHVDLPVDTRTYSELYEDLLPYERLIGSGLASLMVAHVRYPQVDGLVASLSPFWMQTELRRNLAFTGVIFSDDLSMRALDNEGDMPARVRRTLEAGADMALICNDRQAADAVLSELVGYSNPPAAARLVTMRSHAPKGDRRPPLRETSEWQGAVVALDQARARPTLALNG